MGRGNYRGGSTIIGPRDNPRRLENTRPIAIEEDRSRSRFHGGGRETAEVEDWVFLGFDTCRDMLLATQHGVLTGDLRKIQQVATEYGDPWVDNMYLRMANFLMVGRRFDRGKGGLVIKKEGRLDWRWHAIAALVRAARLAWDEEVDDDEIPTLDPEFRRRLAEGLGTGR